MYVRQNLRFHVDYHGREDAMLGPIIVEYGARHVKTLKNTLEGPKTYV